MLGEDHKKYYFNQKSSRSYEEAKIAKEGFPTLGDNSVMTIIIKESNEFKVKFIKLIFL